MDIRTQQATLSEQAVQVENWQSYLLSVSKEEWILAEAFPKATDLEEGRILVIPPIPLLPKGALKKITSIRKEGKQYLLSVEDAELAEAYKRIHIDFTYHAYEESLQKEAFTIKKQAFNFVDLSLGSSGESLRFEPTFGINGSYVFELDVDFERQIFNSFRFGIQNARFGPELTSEIFANAKGSAKVSATGIPIYSFVIPVPPNGAIPVNIQLVMETFADVEIEGGVKVLQSLTNREPIDIIFSLDPQNLPSPFVDIEYLNDNQNLEDFAYQISFEEVQGQGTLSAGIAWNFQATVFNLFDLFNAFFKVGGPVFVANVATDFQGSELVANITGDLKFPVEVGLTQSIFSAPEYGLEREFAFELGEPSLGLYDTTLVLPCDVRFLDYDLQVECAQQTERLELSFFCNSNNGSSEGFKLFLNDQDLGKFAYNQQHSRTLLAARMSNFDEFTFRDIGRSSCRIEVKRSNPCDAIAYCTAPPFSDARDGQQYCFQKMADGKTWMSSPLLYNAGQTVGACHSDNPNLCLDLGRYYSYDELLPGEEIRGICPEGWHVPSKEEWINLFDAEKDMFGSVRPLMAPGLSRFGNVSEQESKGFNLLPTGQFQRWKLTGGQEQNYFSNSLLEEDEPLAILWTRDVVDESTGSFEASQGAKAIAVKANGSYLELRTPKVTGLVCRCVKD